MTRINLVDPQVLTNRHLLAEYKEITQILHPLKMSLNRVGSINKLKLEIPSKYTLNGGHVKFWYDKGNWILNRMTKLKDELLTRGVNVNIDLYLDRCERIKTTFPPELFGDYVYTRDDVLVNAERIYERIKEKPHLYNDQELFLDFYSKFLS